MNTYSKFFLGFAMIALLAMPNVSQAATAQSNQSFMSSVWASISSYGRNLARPFTRKAEAPKPAVAPSKASVSVSAKKDTAVVNTLVKPQTNVGVKNATFPVVRPAVVAPVTSATLNKPVATNNTVAPKSMNRTSLDLDFSGEIDSGDLGLALLAYGDCPEKVCPEDVDGDGVVGKSDIDLITSNYGPLGTVDKQIPLPLGVYDLDHSGEIDSGDIGLALLEFGNCSAESVCPEDVTKDRVVDKKDVDAIVAHFGPIR